MAKFCKNCGTKLIENASFCGECGMSLLDEIDVKQEVLQTQYCTDQSYAEHNCSQQENVSCDAQGRERCEEQCIAQSVQPAASVVSREQGASYKRLGTIFAIFAIAVQLLSAVLFAFLPIYKASVSVTTSQGVFGEQVKEKLRSAGAKVPVEEEFSALDVNLDEISSLDFLDVETEEFFVYIAMGLAAFCAVGAFAMLIGFIAKKSVHPSLSLLAIFTQVIMIVGMMVFMIVDSNSLKDAVSDFLLSFSRTLAFDREVAVEGASMVGVSVWGFVLTALAALSVLLNSVAAVAFSLRRKAVREK